MKIMNTFLNTLLGGMLLLSASVWAKDDVEGEFDIGAWYVSEDSYRFGKYTGLTDDGWEGVLNFRISDDPAWDSDDTTYWRFQGWRIGLDSMRLKFDWADQGTRNFSAEYREIPNYRFSDGMSPFNGIGTDALTLPSNWVGPENGTTGSFATLQENLKPVRSSWERERLDLSFEQAIDRNWSFNIDLRHEEKDGVGTFGGVIGNSGGNPRAVVLPRPIDFETDIMEVTFGFANARYQYGFSLFSSWFDNGQKSVTWDNPYGQRSGWADGVGFPDGRGLYSLEPSNEAMQFRVYGGINFDNRSRLSADISVGSMKQDNSLFAYSINPALDVHTPLPRMVMDAKIDTTFANIRYTARPTDRLSILAAYTLDDRDNKTPREEWIYIGGDSQNQKDAEDARINLPYSYEREQLDFSATYRASRGVRLRGGIELTDYSRTFSEVLSSDETRLFGSLTLRQWEKVSLSFDYETSERDVDDYVGNRPHILSHLPGTEGPDDFENLPALRKFNQTDRERDQFRFRADLTPSALFSAAFVSSWSDDDYNDADNLFGLQKSEVYMWSVDAGLHPGNGVSITAFYTVEEYDSEQSSRSWNSRTPGSEDDPDRNWFANSEDDVTTWNLALSYERAGEESGGGLEFGIDFTKSDVESDINVFGNARISATPLPTLVSEMSSWSVFGTYQINDQSAVRLSYEKQDLNTRDFSLDNVPVDGPSNVLLLGRSAPNYDLSLLMLSYVHRYD